MCVYMYVCVYVCVCIYRIYTAQVSVYAAQVTIYAAQVTGCQVPRGGIFETVSWCIDSTKINYVATRCP